jgi:hypothetical protein
MNSGIEDLLAQLETVSTELTEMTERSLAGADNLLEVLDLLSHRGSLVERVSSLLAQSAPVSYSEWNRLVIIHYQGQRIDTNLSTKRADILSQLTANAQGQTFLNRMTSLVEAPHTASSINI